MTNPSRILIDGSKFGLDWLKINWYGALIVTGIILAYVLCSHEAKRRKFHKDCVIDLCLVTVPLGVIFARLYYIVFEWNAFVKPGMTFGQVLLGMINIRQGGLAIYGAIIGGVLGAVLYTRRKKMHFLSVSDMILPTVALAQAIGRWGNFFNQEAYGRLIDEGFPPYFPLAVKIDECTQSCCANLTSKLGHIHYATFFYEFCWCLIIFIVLWFFVRKRAKHRGDATFIYLAMYGFERALVEGLRTDSLMLGSLRVSQVLSAVLCVGSVAFLIIRTVMEKKRGTVLMPVEEIYYGEKTADTPKKKDDGWEDVPAAEASETEETADTTEDAEADTTEAEAPVDGETEPAAEENDDEKDKKPDEKA